MSSAWQGARHQSAAEISDEQVLRAGQARFQQMADAIPQIVWVTDGEGCAEYFNQQWRDYTGLSYDPKNAAEAAAAAVHPDDIAVTMERFEHAKMSGDVFEVEHRIRSASGQYRWFLVRAHPFREPGSDGISRWFGASVDIHDRKQTERAMQLLAARQSFQLALADATRPLTDPDEVVRIASALLGERVQAERVFYGEIDKTGQFIDLTRDWTSGTLTSMAGQRLRLSDFGSLIIDDVRAGRIVAVSDVTVDAKTRDNAAAYLATGVRAFLAIPLMKKGVLRATLNVHRSDIHQWSELDIAMADDMTDRTWAAVERARSQATLRTERDRSRSVFDAMTEGFAMLSKDWTVLQMNEAGLRVGQRDAADVLGKNHWDVWPETVGTEAEQRYRRVMATRVPEAWEYQQTFADGQLVWLEVRAYPAGEGDLAVFFRDVTERKVSDQKLRDADRRKDEFLAMLAHELRNPLAPIGAAAQLLQMGKFDADRVRQTSQIISRQVNHMTHLIDDLLDVSRVTRGLVELDTQPLDIRRIVVDAVEQVNPLMQARRHHLTLHLPSETVNVMGDKKRLIQVLANILTNAAKYTNEGGTIALKAKVDGKRVLFEIVDNGIGMAADLSAHAFDLFAQAERSSDRSAGGLGLGLALVKNLVELHGGSVHCSSPGLGKGSTFCVLLPLLAEPAFPVSPEEGHSLQTAATPLRILVVDDNTDAAEMLAMLLESVGHEVTTAHRAHIALELARTMAPDVFVLDIGLPEIDGNELARLLRACPEGAGALLIAVTGYGQEADRRRTQEAGFDHHLVKPVDLNELSEILSQVRGKAH